MHNRNAEGDIVRNLLEGDKAYYMLSLQERPKMQCEIKDAVHSEMRLWYANAATICHFRLVSVWFNTFSLHKFSNIATCSLIISLTEL